MKHWDNVNLLQRDKNRTVGARLVAVMFFDSFTYFVSVSVLFVMLALVTRYASEAIFDIVITPAFAITSILGNRMLLNIPSTYEAALQDQEKNLPSLRVTRDSVVDRQEV
ncbi:hypothetical protein SISSUDRAFT_1047341 [Sistotremastrum suecicum HHB10207 ss-3]|uniref:Uncharacterized protein n=1 Tax=Sistotremastrum suecicum HHB10207 ss-3 TaxID=1314776 RepID=A0A166D806_9AGAM|nr:hypothetical protein SISSUDRAFT_1047341 [Sistotremastrum suecicum HHB10207 ss-3]